MTAFIVAVPLLLSETRVLLPINKLCHKVSCISRPSEEAASREAKIKVVTKHNFSKFLGLFRLIKVVTAKVQPEKITGRTPC